MDEIIDTKQELLAILQTVGLPVAFDHFETPQALPYIAYVPARHNTFAADNVAYYRTTAYSVELYTEYKNPALEEAVEAALTAAGLYYDIDIDDYLTTEQMYMVAYTVTI